MCGIVGVLAPFPKQRCLEIVHRMTESVAHRGPDDEGCWADDGFGFGMRRLSIIDLPGGHQPMWDDEQGLGIVFNGEIYNYRDLRTELGGDTAFRTHSDTEVVLRSLGGSGLPAVDKWNGMFAVAAWNPRAKKLLLVRDRIGVKPLYYFWDGKVFAFASEIKALLASGLVARRINRQAVWDYLTFRYIPGPDAIWEGVRKLPPGHALEIDAGAAPNEIEYWRTDVAAVAGERRPTQVIDREFTELFLDAVRLRLIAADVPVGVLLSGGLDSSAVAAAAVELGHRNFHTFSVGFDDADYSELPFAREMAKLVSAQHHEVRLDRRGFLDMLPEVVVSADEPLADLASVPLLMVSRLARADVKVVLSGEGSDELLAGYDLDRAQRKWQLVRGLQRLPPAALRAAATALGTIVPRFKRAARRVAFEPLSQWNRRDLEHMTWVLDEVEKRQLWPAGGGTDSARVMRALYAEAHSDEPLEQLLSVYQRSWLVEDLLMKADKMSMATSLELRTPFLDYRLVEWANRQPTEVKVERTGFLRYRTKAVLRRFCATRIPAAILTRPKMGFPVPAYVWLQRGLDQWAKGMLLGPESRTAQAFNTGAVSALIQQSATGDSRSAHGVWSLLILEHWLRAWNATL